MAVDKHIDVPDEFDALLRKALSVEPSPAFLPRVRERIREQPHGVHWNWRLWLTGAAAAAVCVAAVVVTGMTDRVTARLPLRLQCFSRRSSSEARPIAGPSAPKTAAPAGSEASASAHRRTPGRLPLSRGHCDQPVVIVDERQRAALTLVMRMVSEGRLTEDAFKHTTPPSMQPIRDFVVPIGVKPVELSPLAVGGVLQSEK